ncbi:MAG: transcription-repair coupling factor [Myxococcales bacterium]|nr:transcription-repair coupling factor [Myxococcales bacterium]
MNDLNELPEVLARAHDVDTLARRLNDPALRRCDLVRAHGGSLGFVLAEVARGARARPLLVVAPDGDEARKLAADVQFFLGSTEDLEAAEEGRGEVLLLPASESSPYVEVAPDRRTAMARLATLFHLSQGLPWKVLIAPLSALARKVVPRAALGPRCDLVQAEELVDRTGLIRGLSEGGYLRVPVVEDPGTYAVRGAVIDVWAPSSRWPARIEMEEELCLSIKLFDPEGQRTIRTVKELFIHPAREALVGEAERSRAKKKIRDLIDAVEMPSNQALKLLDDVDSGRAFFGAEGFLPAYYEGLEAFADYLPEALTVVWDRPDRGFAELREALSRAESDYAARLEKRQPTFALREHYLSEDAVLAELLRRPAAVVHALAVRGRAEPQSAAWLEVVDPEAEVLDVGAESLKRLADDIKAARTEKGKADALVPLAEQIAYWLGENYRVFLTGRTPTQTERLATLLRAHHTEAKTYLGHFHHGLLGAEQRPPSPMAEVITGEIARGFVLPSVRLAVVTEEEVFGARSRRNARRRAKGDNARPFLDDLRALSVGDYVVHVDHGIGKYVGIEHRKVGVSETDLLVIEYSGGDRLYLPVTRLNQIQKFSGSEGAPRVDKLGGSTFAKAKAKVARAVRQMADELLRIHAERKAHPGRVFEEPGSLFQEFEATFPFEETQDQLRAIEEVVLDLARSTPMDRLVCGDVGFGKTEVALRAAFHVASTGAQVAVLCPTTVLAQQHFRTFAERMSAYPLEVAVLSRFVTNAEQRDVIKRLKEGKIDVVVGTHRLLSKDVHFKDLGLLIVDEEQRFGVTHKERIKQLKNQLDVLTLSATPIPRTLQMAVSGMRDLSLITTAPVDRRAVRTVVSKEDPQLLKEAVQRELARGGQVFYVYNRVEGLYERADKLQKLLPHARVAVAHGQMDAEVLETVMMDFIEGRYDVLCATAIIESGIDIPRANTIILDRADLFGLSQLYQLRGRVGRSRERAYCYLFVPPPSQLSDEARSRIEAIEKFTELGSGFHVASLDLELRGAGDLLGGEQSGNVSAVGFDLYCQMLEEAVAELRGQPVVQGVEPELTFDEPNFLPEEYIEDVGVRLSLYKRFASARDEDEVAELAAEMEDRFGPAPAPARIFVRVMALKTRVRALRALGLEAHKDRVVLHLRDDSPIDAAKVMELCATRKSPWRLTPDMRLTRRFEGGSEGIANAEKTLSELDPLIVGAS